VAVDEVEGFHGEKKAAGMRQQAAGKRAAREKW
jgi:hypothetical protein